MSLAEKVAPAHTALLVIDMQRDYFCKGGIIDLMGHDYESTGMIVDPLNRFVDAARSSRVGLVIFTRQTMFPHMRSAAVVEHYGRAGMERPFDASREDFYGVVPLETDIVIRKPKYSAFVSTALDGMLRANQIQTLIVTGVATNVCVESTARHAFMLDYQVVVPRDLTAGVDPDFKEWSLRNIDTFFGEVTGSEDILRAWAAVG